MMRQFWAALELSWMILFACLFLTFAALVSAVMPMSQMPDSVRLVFLLLDTVIFVLLVRGFGVLMSMLPDVGILPEDRQADWCGLVVGYVYALVASAVLALICLEVI